MSKQEDEDEKRLYQCAKKYEKIVKQFDELMEIMNDRSRPLKRRRRPSSSSKGSWKAPRPASPIEAENKEAFVHTITKFLHDLRAKTDVDFSTSTTYPD
uniref:Uncharacterized protein n=1 Tax=Manihot esculenta TaxID=3983 RepID=A0A2C9V8F4_MANES